MRDAIHTNEHIHVHNEKNSFLLYSSLSLSRAMPPYADKNLVQKRSLRSHTFCNVTAHMEVCQRNLLVAKTLSWPKLPASSNGHALLKSLVPKPPGKIRTKPVKVFQRVPPASSNQISAGLTFVLCFSSRSGAQSLLIFPLTEDPYGYLWVSAKHYNPNSAVPQQCHMINSSSVSHCWYTPYTQVMEPTGTRISSICHGARAHKAAAWKRQVTCRAKQISQKAR
jgi:hypothetical protein